MTADSGPFNTPLEAGLRGLFVLLASGRRSLDVQRLIYLDYATVHTADFGGPTSLHPRTPSQGAQLLVRRALIQDGLELMCSRELVERLFLSSGIRYRAAPAGHQLGTLFSSTYSQRLRERAEWVVERFGTESDTELQAFFTSRLRPLGGELVADYKPGGSSVHA